MTTFANRLDSVAYWTEGYQPVSLEELLTPADEYTDPAPSPTEIVDGLFLVGTREFSPAGAPTPTTPIVETGAFDIVVTVDPDAAPVGPGAEEIRVGFANGVPVQPAQDALAALVAELYPRWLDGADILVRSRFGINRAALVMALILQKAGVEPTVAVQLMRSVRSEFVLHDTEALTWLIAGQ